MRLHRTIALNLALIITGLIVIFYLLSTFVLIGEFTSIESQHAQKDMERVYSAYRIEAQSLESVTRDWSSWDDTYAFIENRSSAYLASNMVPGTFINNRLNVILFINRTKALIHGEAFDLQQNQGMNLPVDLLASLEAEEVLDTVLENEQGRTDILPSSDGAFLLASMPILTSDNTGPTRGVLVMGRSIDTHMVERFEQATSLDLRIIGRSELPSEVLDPYSELSKNRPYVLAPINESLLQGYLFLGDNVDAPDVIIQALIPRDFSLAGSSLSRYFFSLLIAVAIVFGMIVLIVLEKGVLSRIATLSTSVAEIEASGDLNRRVPEEGDDEIATFSRGMNRMLSALQKAESAVGIQNRQLTAVNEIISAVSNSDTSEQIFFASLRKTIDMLAFDMGAMFSINLETKKAELKAHAGIPPQSLHDVLASGSIIDIHSSPHNQVFTLAVPVYYEGDSGEERHEEQMPILSLLGIRSLAIIPLRAGSAVLGVLYAGWTGPHHFTDYEKEIFTTIGQEVGNALFKAVLQDKLVAAMTRAEISHENAEKARDEANLYLDIMTHDINNVNQTALGYILLLSEPGDEPRDQLLGKLENAVTKSSDIIRQVSVIRRIREIDKPLHVMNMDPVIRDVIRHYADNHIIYQGSPASAYADELISEIFMNLVGNALKFGGMETTVTIDVRPKGEFLEITVRDTGPGIPDTLKPVLFQRYNKGTSAKSGKGLGLYIVRMLVERYGGKIWVEDAESGHLDRGAAVKFTLRQADPKQVPDPGIGKLAPQTEDGGDVPTGDRSDGGGPWGEE
jgi:two-component system sensor histidine kinase KdpD